MENKKVGVVILIVGIILLVIFLIVIRSLNQEIKALGCYQDPSCKKVETSLSFVHFAFGGFGFLFALGFYLLFFSRGEEAIVKRLEDDTHKKLQEDTFSILSKGLDSFEKKALDVIRQEEGITQSTLRLRVDMSKAKLSQVLTGLEKKGLIRREQKQKTLALYLKEKL